jgi:hypothetical protein
MQFDNDGHLLAVTNAFSNGVPAAVEARLKSKTQKEARN